MMKISRLSEIALSGLLLLPTFGAVAADPYTMYRLAKDPEQRALVLQRMQAARDAAGQRLQS
jgi:hypothetical protein